jgi:hypothetical protein
VLHYVRFRVLVEEKRSGFPKLEVFEWSVEVQAAKSEHITYINCIKWVSPLLNSPWVILVIPRSLRNVD